MRRAAPSHRLTETIDRVAMEMRDVHVVERRRDIASLDCETRRGVVPLPATPQCSPRNFVPLIQKVTPPSIFTLSTSGACRSSDADGVKPVNMPISVDWAAAGTATRAATTPATIVRIIVITERRQDHDIAREIGRAGAGANQHAAVTRHAEHTACIHPAFEGRRHAVRSQIVLQIVRRAINPDHCLAFEPEALVAADHSSIIAHRIGRPEKLERQPDAR